MAVGVQPKPAVDAPGLPLTPGMERYATWHRLATRWLPFSRDGTRVSLCGLTSLHRKPCFLEKLIHTRHVPGRAWCQLHAKAGCHGSHVAHALFQVDNVLGHLGTDRLLIGSLLLHCR